MYSKYNSDKKRVAEVVEEENKFNDISIVMELLMNLLAKDFIDFGPEGAHLQPFFAVFCICRTTLLLYLKSAPPLSRTETTNMSTITIKNNHNKNQKTGKKDSACTARR